MTARKSTPGAPGTLWIGGRVLTPFSVREPEPTRSEIVLWLDATHNQLLVGKVVAPGQSPSLLGDELETVLRRPRSAPPGRVRVRSEADADEVRRVLPVVPIEVGPVPEFDRIISRMSKELGRDSQPSYLGGGGLTSAHMALYFERMAALWTAAPWRFFDDTQVLELDVPALGMFGGCVSVLGSAKQSYGAVLFDSFEDFEQFYSLAPHERPDDEPLDLGVASLGLSFARGAILPDSMRREVSEQGWPVARADAFPLLMPVDPDGYLRPATERELQLACAAAEALVALARQHGAVLRRGGPVEVRSSTVAHVPEAVEATIAFPHSLASEEEDRDWPSDAEVASAREQGERRIEAFLASPGVTRRRKAWRTAAAFMLGALHDFKLDQLDGRLAGLRAWQLAAFLLEYVPRAISADADTVSSTPEIIDGYLAWLGEIGHEPETVMTRTRERVLRHSETFLKRALDPGAFGPGKTFAMSLQAAGVDLADASALEAHRQRYNREVAPLEGARRSGTPRIARAEQARVRREIMPVRRWFPLEGEPVPAGDAPCPCGSGRRFGKCCMER